MLGAALLVWRHPLAALMARAAAPVGACFALVCLITGSLWGRPMWGTYWVWDARLTSMLLLFFLYLGHIALSRAYDDPERGDRAAAILALIGVINLPIIKFSVDWWNTLHQPASVARLGGPSIHPAILMPLLWMAGAFLLLFILLVLVRTETEIDRRRLEIADMQAPERHEQLRRLHPVGLSRGVRHPGRAHHRLARRAATRCAASWPRAAWSKRRR